jgi:hypothetical protein
VTTHPEQAVLDAIAGLEQDEIGELVRWQIEEGIRRGDGPTSSDSRTDTLAGTIMGGPIAFYEGVSDQFSRRYHLPADFGEPSSMPSFQIGWGGSSSSD